MKKILCTMTMATLISGVVAQGILGKIKNKLSNNAAQNAQQGVAAQAGASVMQATAPAGVSYTRPEGFGTVINTFDQRYMNAHPDGYNFWFTSVQVVNNQLVLKIADHGEAEYSYSDGAFVPTGNRPDLSIQNFIPNNSEQDSRSVDFSQADMAAAMLKNRPSVTSGQVPGKVYQTYTFNGNVIGNYMMATEAHNADSTVVVVLGMLSGPKGMTNAISTSNGVQATLPKLFGGFPLISPDGKQVAAVYLNNKQVILATGMAYNISDISPNLWLRNTGSVFSISANDPKVLLRNGEVYYTSNFDINPRMLFISADDKNFCLAGYRGLYFSDGTAFENGSSPTKVILDGREVIVFLDMDMGTGKLYLCKHNL